MKYPLFLKVAFYEPTVILANMRIDPKNPHILMLIYTALVSASFHIGQLLIQYMDSITVTFIRFLLGSVLFGLYVIPKYKVKMPNIPSLLRYFAISASMILYFWAMFEALRYTTPLKTGIIYTITPLFTAVYGIFLLKERISPKNFCVLLIAMLGAIWVVIDGSPAKLISMEFNKGDLIFLAGCFSIGLYSPFSKLLHRGEPMPVLTLWTMITGTIWLLLLANTKILKINIAILDHKFLLGILYITIFSTIATFFILQYSSKKLPVSKVMSYVYLIPIFIIVMQISLGEGLPGVAVIPGVVASLFATAYFLTRKKI